MHVTAIILAGGKGKRMNSDVPKQYIDINGKPLLYYTIKAFQESSVDEIVLVVGDSVLNVADGKKIDGTVRNEMKSETEKSELDYCQNFVSEYGLTKVAAFAAGGSERYDSVANGLECVTSDADIVLVHDGARPCVTPQLINKCIEDVVKYGSGVTAVPAKDTIKVVDPDGFVTDTPDRSTLWQIQTPQGFLRSELCEAYAKLKNAQNAVNITDDAMVVECFGRQKVHITMGEYTNIKITTADDLEIARLRLV